MHKRLLRASCASHGNAPGSLDGVSRVRDAKHAVCAQHVQPAALVLRHQSVAHGRVNVLGSHSNVAVWQCHAAEERSHGSNVYFWRVLLHHPARVCGSAL